MLFRFIIWMIITFIAVKFVGTVLRALRTLLTPNSHIGTVPPRRHPFARRPVDDIPYEDVSKE